MQHAGHPHVMHIDEFAGRLGRKVDARLRLADNGVGIRRLDRHVVGEFEPDGFIGDQFAIADAAIVVAADQAVFDREVLHRQFQPLRGARQQELPRLRGGLAQRDRGDLNGLAGDGRTLIGNARGIAQHHDDARKGHVELFGDDLPKRGPNPGSKIDMAIEGGDRTVGRDLV